MSWINSHIQNGRINHRFHWARCLQLVLMAFFLLTAVSCDNAKNAADSAEKKPSAETEKSGSDDPKPEDDQTENNTAADDNSTEFVNQELGQLDSPFTRETVIELNAIVARSLASIEAFDEARKTMVAGNGDSTANTLKRYRELAKKAKQAKVDMDAAGKKLLASGEKYNDAIFEAMVRFVNNVEVEIRKEIAAISQTENADPPPADDDADN